VCELVVVPAFHLAVRRESADSKIARLLVQALRLPVAATWVVARPVARYGGQQVPLGGPASHDFPSVDENGRPVVIRRDVAAEFGAVTMLRQLGLESLAGDPRCRFLLAFGSRGRDLPPAEAGIWFPNPDQFKPAHYWPWLRSRGSELLAEAGWTVEFAPEVGHEVFDLEPETIRYELSEAGGWFQLSVGFEVAGRRFDLLPILAEVLENGSLDGLAGPPAGGQILHYLDDGSALRLPVDRMRAILRHFAALLDPRRFADGKLRLHPLDAAVLGAAAELPLEAPPRLAALAAGLRDFAGVAAAALPRGLRAQLRVYQLAGFRWMQFLARHELHGILADDMGLGKTLQTLAHLLAEKDSGRSQGRPSLVVAPTSVVPNWCAEAARFAPGLRLLVLEGARRHGYFRAIPHADLVVTSYALLQRDIEDLLPFQYHLAILDEAQQIKNPRAKVAQAACRLEARHRLCLSGTPVENHLGELWSLLRFLMPGLLGSEADFQQRFRVPIERGGDDERRDALKRRVAPLILRRTKDQVAGELPPKTELIHSIELTSLQQDLYETVRATMDKRVRAAIAARGLEGSRMVFLEALLKLRQICCDPRLLKLDKALGAGASAGDSGKLLELADLLETLVEEGRRILLFSQFTSMLALIEEMVVQRGIAHLVLTGSSKDRGGLVRRFQGGGFPLFLISLKAGGTGLNLTAADTVIHYDPWWNPAAQAQATDRAHRIGQDQPVFVHQLLCRGTVEERIHQLQQKKRELAEGLLADSARAAAPDAATLAELLAPVA
jgi:superfamily II DNA or RNA helicase